MWSKLLLIQNGRPYKMADYNFKTQKKQHIKLNTYLENV